MSGGQGYGQRTGFRRTHRAAAWAVPALPDGSRIPKGSKFFYWMSGGGRFILTTGALEGIIELEDKINKEELKTEADIETETPEKALDAPPEESATLEEMLKALDEGKIEIEVKIDEDNKMDIVFFDSDKKENHVEL